MMDVLSVESAPLGLAARPGMPQVNAPATAVRATSSNTGTPAADEGKNALAPGAVATAIKQVNDAFGEMGQSLYASYQKDKITGIEVVQFRDQETHEVVRQVPSKEILAIAQSLSLPPGIQGQLIYDKA